MVTGKASPEDPEPSVGLVWSDLPEQAANPAVAVAASSAAKVLLESTVAPFVSRMTRSS